MFIKQAFDSLQNMALTRSFCNVGEETAQIYSQVKSGALTVLLFPPVRRRVDILILDVLWLMTCSLVLWCMPQGTGSLHLHVMLSSRATRAEICAMTSDSLRLTFYSQTVQPLHY